MERNYLSIIIDLKFYTSITIVSHDSFNGLSASIPYTGRFFTYTFIEKSSYKTLPDYIFYKKEHTCIAIG